ncbi:iron complex outermembrane recepter protein [Tenacibaculum sp. 190524A02b]|uniref:Iron complex outermembrane recepter protein n=1 Tax=Tenacibaculum vairaonense TaxID=3137860 RepID=A0ABM9PN25_9FLAO
MGKKILLTILFMVSFAIVNAQISITGNVYDEYLEPFSNAKIKTLDTNVTSGSDGSFSLKTEQAFPFTIQVTAFGYKTESLEITSKDQEINIVLKENTSLDEVVISASRSPERVIESPVTIERMGISDIKRNSSASFYDGLVNLKGIESREANYGFKSVNSRGFSTFDNTRFVQLVDGVETSIPALNFSAGNIVGLSELDVRDIEILPGASSALYGANAFNGILLMRSKNPFDYDGISTYIKGGYTSQEQAGNNSFYDVGIRMAHRFSNKLAAKANLTYFRAEEWHANSLANTTGPGGEIITGTRSNPGYDGLNVYGDDFAFSLRQIAELGGVPQVIGLLPDPDQRITRTGFEEKDIADYGGENVKFDGALHYRPWGDEDLEIVLNARVSRGNNVYQGTNRFSQKNYFVQQYKLEFLGKNFFLRGYYTGNDSGNSYDLRFAGIAMNELIKPSIQWFGEYLNRYIASGFNHVAARDFADANRPVSGSNQYENLLNQVINKPIDEGGAALIDQTSFYHADANYNFRDIIKWGEVQIGGSYRIHNVNSNGTLFTDKFSRIRFDNYGAYVQLQKKFLEDKLKFTGSIRYDKSKNFEGNFSPRIALNYSLGEGNDHVLRASYQTGFRNPSITEQYFGLRTGANRFILGTADENLDRFSTTINNNNGSVTTLTGRDAFSNAFLSSSVINGTPIQANVAPIKPEKVASYEIGYRSIIGLTDKNLLELDINAYYNQYDDFVAFKNVIVPNYGKIVNGLPNLEAQSAFANGDLTEFVLNTNSLAEVSSYGVGLGLNTKVLKTFNIGLNYTLSKMIFDEESDPNFNPGFNTPEHQVKLMFGNPNLFKNFGFNISARWQNEFLWQSSFINSMVDQRTVLDAQINYRVPVMKSRFKLGGTNLTQNEYVVAPGSGNIGSLYYLSWTIND